MVIDSGIIDPVIEQSVVDDGAFSEHHQMVRQEQVVQQEEECTLSE